MQSKARNPNKNNPKLLKKDTLRTVREVINIFLGNNWRSFFENSRVGIKSITKFEKWKILKLD